MSLFLRLTRSLKSPFNCLASSCRRNAILFLILDDVQMTLPRMMARTYSTRTRLCTSPTNVCRSFIELKISSYSICNKNGITCCFAEEPVDSDAFSQQQQSQPLKKSKMISVFLLQSVIQPHTCSSSIEVQWNTNPSPNLLPNCPIPMSPLTWSYLKLQEQCPAWSARLFKGHLMQSVTDDVLHTSVVIYYYNICIGAHSIFYYSLFPTTVCKPCASGWRWNSFFIRFLPYPSALHSKLPSALMTGR